MCECGWCLGVRVGMRVGVRRVGMRVCLDCVGEERERGYLVNLIANCNSERHWTVFRRSRI